ncbi:MAG: N-acetylglucosamine-6-phosphate deacetylase [Cyanobacteria bacterium P01_H01_bin.74]
MRDDLKKIIITDTTIVSSGQMPYRASVVIEEGIITAISETVPAGLLIKHENVEIISGKDHYLTPGLIELHFNGALGCDLNNAKINAIQSMLTQLPQYGITSAVLTIITNPLTEMLSAVHTLEAVIHHYNGVGAKPIGIHLEGPFLSTSFPGVHNQAAVRGIDFSELDLLLSPTVKWVTLSPELSGSTQMIETLCKRNITVSAGHTNATHEEIQHAVSVGLNSVTHLFNACRPFHHREPGLIGTVLADDTVYVQFIGDGVHIHPQTMKLILAAKPIEKVLLTSDASPLAGMPPGASGLFTGNPISVADSGDKVLSADGRLAGSTKLVSGCIKTLLSNHVCTFSQAVQFATSNVADFLKMPDYGKVDEGMFADLVLWNKQSLTVEKTLINGNVVYDTQT